MKKIFFIISVFAVIFACQEKEKPVVFEKYDETAELATQQKHEKKRMQFKLIQSKYLDMNEVFKPFDIDLASFSEEKYNRLKRFILEEDIPSLQKNIKEEKLTYEELTLFTYIESENLKAIPRCS